MIVLVIIMPHSRDWTVSLVAVVVSLSTGNTFPDLTGAFRDSIVVKQPVSKGKSRMQLVTAFRNSIWSRMTLRTVQPVPKHIL